MGKKLKNFAIGTIIALQLFWILVLHKLPTPNIPQCDQRVIRTSSTPENLSDFNVGNLVKYKNPRDYGKKKLAVIVPMRGCFEEVTIFVPHMTKFLNEQKIPHHIFVVQQTNNLRFNKPTMQNVGYIYTKDYFDYIALHDVDILPLNQELSYEFHEDCVFHVASPNYFVVPKYGAWLGAIVLIPNAIFELIDGMCSHYWGWGLEDDELIVNLQNHNIKVKRPPNNLTTDRSSTFRDIHDTMRRPRDVQKCNDQTKLYIHRTPNSGLKDTNYIIQSVQELVIDGSEFTLVNGEVPCDMNLTPWCNCSAKV